MKLREPMSIFLTGLFIYMILYPELVHSGTHRWEPTDSYCYNISIGERCSQFIGFSSSGSTATSASVVTASNGYLMCELSFDSGITQQWSPYYGHAVVWSDVRTTCPSADSDYDIMDYVENGTSGAVPFPDVYAGVVGGNNGFPTDCYAFTEKYDCVGYYDGDIVDEMNQLEQECQGDIACVLEGAMNSGTCTYSSTTDEIVCQADWRVDTPPSWGDWEEDEDGGYGYNDPPTTADDLWVDNPGSQPYPEGPNDWFCEGQAGCYSDGSGQYYDIPSGTVHDVPHDSCMNYGSGAVCGPDTPDHALPTDSFGNPIPPENYVSTPDGGAVYYYPQPVVNDSVNVSDGDSDGNDFPSAAAIGAAVARAQRGDLDGIRDAVNDTKDAVVSGSGDIVAKIGEAIDAINAGNDSGSETGTGEGEGEEQVAVPENNGEFTDLSAQVQTKQDELFDVGTRLHGVYGDLQEYLGLELPADATASCESVSTSSVSFEICNDKLLEILSMLSVVIIFLAYIEAFQIIMKD